MTRTDRPTAPLDDILETAYFILFIATPAVLVFVYGLKAI